MCGRRGHESEFDHRTPSWNQHGTLTYCHYCYEFCVLLGALWNQIVKTFFAFCNRESLNPPRDSPNLSVIWADLRRIYIRRVIYEGWCVEITVSKDLLCRFIHTFRLMPMQNWLNMWLMPEQTARPNQSFMFPYWCVYFTKAFYLSFNTNN